MIFCQRFAGKILKRKKKFLKNVNSAELCLPGLRKSEPQANKGQANANCPLTQSFCELIQLQSGNRSVNKG